MTNASWTSHQIAYPETFDLRRPLLEILKKDLWRVSDDGKKLEVKYPLGDLSPGERAIVEFALSPYYTAENIFHLIGATPGAPAILAKAIYEFFKDGGPEGARR